MGINMYLKSIEVHGFKSFANKINFEFHNGITGIVGPNGSGKSNVGDAVRWVLGEQRIKQLRGASMQDVIFSGTENRKPLGYAYVAITLDNSDHKLPVDYEEVTVARRVYRSGESEYLINGAGCRLKDVNELFYDTGIGKEGYSIIGQGQIDKILNGRPEERRELFDEAAGIVKFKRRKAAAQKKLEDEKQNLTRINDILSELEKQVGPLEKQSLAAKEYLKKKEELKIYDVNLFLLETERIKQQLDDLEKKHKIAQSDFDDTNTAYEQTKTEYEKMESELERINTEAEKSKQYLNDTNMMREKLEGQINVLKEQINTAKMNNEHLNSRMGAIEQQITEKEAEKQVELKAQDELDTQLAGAKEQQKKAKEALERVQGRISELNLKIENGKNEIIDSLNEKASTKAKLGRYDTMLEQIQIRKAELNQRLLRIKSDEAEQEEFIKDFREELERVTKIITELSDGQRQRETEIEKIQTDLGKKNGELNNLQISYHKEKSRLDSLKNITERYDGYGNSIRRVMEKKETEPGIIGVVADIIKVDKKYETAVETALGGSIQNIVTDHENTAKKMIAYLKQNKYGRATFLPLTSVGNKNQFRNDGALSEKGVIGLANELVQTEKEYEGLAGYLLGRTIVVDHIDHAITLAKKYSYSLRIVTVEGESLSPGGSMTGGAFKNSSNLLGRRREIEDLEKTVKQFLEQIDGILQSIDSMKKKRTKLYEEIDEIKEKIQEQHILENTAKVKVNQAENRKQETKKGYQDLTSESYEIENQIQEIKENKDAISGELTEMEVREREIEEQIKEFQGELEGELKIEADCSQKASNIELEASNIIQRVEFVVQNLNRITQEIENNKKELELLKDGLVQASKETEKKNRDISEIQKTIEASYESYTVYEKEVKELTEQKEQMTANQKSFFKKREELSERSSMLDKECFRLSSQKEKLEELSENHINYMWDEYEITYNAALELKSEEIQDLAELKKNISSLKEGIKKLGDVNVNAIEEYKTINERFEFLRTQHDDLVTAEQTLKGIIEELDNGMRVQFTEKFKEICTEFDKAFKELFGGGKGSLELMEEEDILEAGIRIIAQPPGKKLQNMMQLSGGEKALAAIALLFAIQNLKPSPFCLLDEIEAALDESNVSKFAKYLNKLTKNTQFIIITHRRGTMAVADRLYGITMQEKGVSALVSVNLIEDELDK